LFFENIEQWLKIKGFEVMAKREEVANKSNQWVI
jgi:hypothetical protein